MKALKFVLILALLSTNLFSQDVNYYFEQFTHTYSDLENPISINNGEIWDDPEYAIAIGFDFSIFNHQTNSLVFGGLGGTLSDTTLNNMLIASALDLADRGYNTNSNTSLSPISYKVDGELGKKVLKIEWKNAGFYEDEEDVYYTNLQLWIYEGSNMIEIHRGSTNIEATFYLWEENFCAFLEMDSLTETATGYLLEEVDGEYQFGFQNMDDFYVPNFFTQIPEDGTVFRFYPEYAIGRAENEKGNINLFPNPTSDFIALQNKQNIKLNYKILSVPGRVVLKGFSSEQNLQIDLRDLNPGMYFIRGSKQGVYFTKSFLKK